MTRKIEDAMVRSVRERVQWASGNTQVQIQSDGRADVYLHGNHIASRDHHGLRWTLAGWNTVTTRSRINALARAFGGYCVSSKNSQAYAGDQAGTITTISDSEWIISRHDGELK